MKRVLFLLLLLLPCVAVADEPITDCPTGYVAVLEGYAEITIADSCDSGTYDAGTAESCLVESPSGECWMFVPAGAAFSDTSGAYEYTAICPLTD